MMIARSHTDSRRRFTAQCVKEPKVGYRSRHNFLSGIVRTDTSHARCTKGITRASDFPHDSLRCMAACYILILPPGSRAAVRGPSPQVRGGAVPLKRRSG